MGLPDGLLLHCRSVLGVLGGTACDAEAENIEFWRRILNEKLCLDSHATCLGYVYIYKNIERASDNVCLPTAIPVIPALVSLGGLDYYGEERV